MIVYLDDDEYDAFIQDATSTEKPQGENWDRLRERFKNHVDKQRSDINGTDK